MPKAEKGLHQTGTCMEDLNRRSTEILSMWAFLLQPGEARAPEAPESFRCCLEMRPKLFNHGLFVFSVSMLVHTAINFPPTKKLEKCPEMLMNAFGGDGYLPAPPGLVPYTELDGQGSTLTAFS